MNQNIFVEEPVDLNSMPNFFPTTTTIVTDNKFMFNCSKTHKSALKAYKCKDETSIKYTDYIEIIKRQIITSTNLDLLL